MSIIYACAEMIAKEPDKTYNTARAQTILQAINALREELTVKAMHKSERERGYRPSHQGNQGDRMIEVSEVWRDDRYCKIKVCVRDTYRRTGRGKSGFEMHYRERQCRRLAKLNGLCQQHLKMKAKLIGG